MNFASLSPESWLALHFAGVALAATSRVSLCRVLRTVVMCLLLTVIVSISLLITAAFWTQQAHAVLSCMTLGTVLVAVVFDRPGHTASDLLHRLALGDDC